MNPWKQTFLSAITLLLISSPVFAGGAYLTELGSPQSVGTAGVANVTNNNGADAAFTNPAGMTGLTEPQLLLGSQLLIPTVRFDSDVATAGGSDGGNSGSVAAIPSLFAVAPLNEDWRLGFGLSVPTGDG